MEDDKWVHGVCRPEDAVREARLGCDFFFALFRWANERTKTEEIQGYRLESEISQWRFDGGKRGKRTREFTKYFFVSTSLTGSTVVRSSVRMTKTSISKIKDESGYTHNNGLTTWRYYLPTVPSRNYRLFLFALQFPRVPPSGSRHNSLNPASGRILGQVDAVGRDLQ